MTITDGADDILALNTMTTSMFSHYAGNIFKSESFVFPVTVSLDETAMKLNNATIPTGHDRRRGNPDGLRPRAVEGRKHASRAL